MRKKDDFMSILAKLAYIWLKITTVNILFYGIFERV